MRFMYSCPEWIREATAKEQGGLCGWCKIPLPEKGSVAHREVPSRHGGEYEMGNVTMLCGRRCHGYAEAQSTRKMVATRPLVYSPGQIRWGDTKEDVAKMLQGRREVAR